MGVNEMQPERLLLEEGFRQKQGRSAKSGKLSVAEH